MNQRRETRPERLTASETMSRRNEDRFHLLMRTELERQMNLGIACLGRLERTETDHNSAAVIGHKEWWKSVIKVCAWLQTHYRVSSHSRITEPENADLSNSTEPSNTSL